MTLVTALAVWLSLGAEPAGPAGLFRAGEAAVVVTVRQDVVSLAPLSDPTHTEVAHLDPQAPGKLKFSYFELSYAPDWNSFGVTLRTPAFGPVKAARDFQRVLGAEAAELQRAAKEQEARREGPVMLKAAFVCEKSWFAERDTYVPTLAECGYAPDPCADGSRAPVPGPGWVAGCAFALKLELKGKGPQGHFTAQVLGTAAPVKGLKLSISSEDRPGTPAGVVHEDK